MESNSGCAVEIAPFHSGGTLTGFVVLGRWPNSTKEWAQLLMVAVRVASLPGLLSTTTIFGVREELPERPQPGTVGLVLAEGTVVGDCPRIFRRETTSGADHVASTLGNHPFASGVLGRSIRMPSSARSAPPRPRASRRVGGSGGGRDGHRHDQSGRSGPDQPPGHRNSGHAARRVNRASRQPDSRLKVA